MRRNQRRVGLTGQGAGRLIDAIGKSSYRSAANAGRLERLVLDVAIRQVFGHPIEGRLDFEEANDVRRLYAVDRTFGRAADERIATVEHDRRRETLQPINMVFHPRDHPFISAVNCAFHSSLISSIESSNAGRK